MGENIFNNWLNKCISRKRKIKGMMNANVNLVKKVAKFSSILKGCSFNEADIDCVCPQELGIEWGSQRVGCLSNHGLSQNVCWLKHSQAWTSYTFADAP